MSLKIIKAGLLDTVQDGGRYGFQHQGINPGGAMDRFSAALANALLGKNLDAAILELHFPAAKIAFQQSAVICITGADFSPGINGDEAPLHQPLAVRKGSVLSFAGKRHGARCYLSLLNEWEIASWLHSYSTNLKAGAGGYDGRQLKSGDEIGFAPIDIKTAQVFAGLPWRYHLPEKGDSGITFIPGPEWDWLTTKSQTAFLNGSFRISPASDRMGYRLQGEGLERRVDAQLVSSAVAFGTVQVLPNGQLIVLMADHQTTGGYPRIATVASAHLPKLAQRGAGEDIKFEMTTTGEAEEAWMAQQKYLRSLQNTCKLKIETWLNAHRH